MKILEESPHVRLARKNIHNAVTEALLIQEKWRAKGVRSTLEQGFVGNVYKVTVKPNDMDVALYKLKKQS